MYSSPVMSSLLESQFLPSIQDKYYKYFFTDTCAYIKKKINLVLANFLISWAVFIPSLCLGIMSGTYLSLNAKGILIQLFASSGSLMKIINKAGCYISPLLVLMISFACGLFYSKSTRSPSKPAWIKFSKKIIFDTASKDLFKCKQGIGYFQQPLILWFCC